MESDDGEPECGKDESSEPSSKGRSAKAAKTQAGGTRASNAASRTSEAAEMVRCVSSCVRMGRERVYDGAFS